MLNQMINDFNNYSGEYDPKKDPYHDRSKTKKDFEFSNEPITRDCFAEVIFFSMFESALVGVIEHANGDPAACYSQSVVLEILKEEQGLSEEGARIAINQLIETDLGPSSPCFLDTSIIEK